MKTKVKELRTEGKMTQQQLADLVHVSSRTIISIEKGQYNPSLMLAYRMAMVFGVSVEELYSEGLQVIYDLMYIELKTGYSDDGPAWIGYVKTSQSKKTIYFNDHAFQKYIGNYSNYIDVETGDEYWISGLKRRESNRHWAGHGKIMIDQRAVKEYLSLIGEKELSLNWFEVVEIEDKFPIERIRKLLNKKDSDK